ncbi:MAG: YjjI family glycine radical enzyme [Oscillospiraceae bacterium]|nr:YjjI family glycine radical enzyme [Oscillospiraceae bacterium]
MATIENIQESALEILKNKRLTHEQQMFNLAAVAQNSLPQAPGPYTDEFEALRVAGVLNDMGEGHYPYVARYIIPDYSKLMKNGSKFLRMDPPKTLYEAVYTLEIAYHNVPSVTHFPVYLGNWGEIFEPFCEGMTDEEIRTIMRGFLLHLDRTLGDSFVHANIGPEKTRVAGIILDLVAELQNAIPNMTLIYDPDITPDDFAEHCIATSLVSANPAFAYDPAYKKDFGKNPYAIASCYNGLPVCGGAFTLMRMNLNRVAEKAQSVDDFFNNVFPHCVEVMCGYMESRITFLVEEAAFFKSNWLVKEGLIDLDNFVGLFGIVGLAECVDVLMQYEGTNELFGKSDAADQMGVRVLDALKEFVERHTSKYSPITDHKFLLHAQVGLGESDTTPGTRIPIGREIPLYDHLRQAGLYHKYFPTGVGDIFPFEVTAKKNPGAILDIFKGAFNVGMRYISTYAEDSDLIRVTGYLVKKSELFAVHDGAQAINDMSLVGYNQVVVGHTLDRKVRSTDESAGQ